MKLSTIFCLLILLFYSCSSKAQLLDDYASALKSMKANGHYLVVTNQQEISGRKFNVCTFKNSIDNDTTILGFWTQNNVCYMVKTISTCAKVKSLKNALIQRLKMKYDSKREGYILESNNLYMFMNAYSMMDGNCSLFIYGQ
jgi:hypothetical protein